MRSMLLLAVLASLFIAASAGSWQVYTDSGCTVTTGQESGAAVNMCQARTLNNVASSYYANCATDPVTLKYWAGVDTCPATTTPSTWGSRAANATGSALCFPFGALYAKVDCSGSAATIAVSSAILAVLAFVANRFTL